jgi:parvulin-like peptidyl-prolyl isomerase
MKKTFAVSLVVLGICAVALAGGCSKDKNVAGGEDQLAARVGDWTLTRVELDRAIESLPENQRKKYSTPETRAELAERYIEEEVYYQQAKKKGYDSDATVRDMVAKYERSAMVGEFYTREIKSKAMPDEQEIHDYYEANKDKYTIQSIGRAQHILSKDRSKLLKLQERIEAGEVPFSTAATLESEDELTRPDGGSLGYFNPGGYIRSIGYSKELTEAAFSMQVGEMKIVKWDKGYSLLVLNEIRPPELRPFEEVKQEISDILTRQEIEAVQKAEFDKLRKQLDVKNYLSDEMMMTQRTPEELWNLAQNSTDSHLRLRYYEQIVEQAPNSEYAAEALFMVGFVYAEELHSTPDADRAFHRVINEYPNAEVAKTAEWMLKNLDKPLPQFEDLEDLQKQIEDQSK